MVLYTCDRCGYNTKQKTHFINHLKRKNICPNTISDIQLSHIVSKYGLDSNIAPKLLQNCSKIAPKLLQIAPKLLQNGKKTASLHQCIFCLKFYSRNSNLKKHLQICKIRKKQASIENHNSNNILSQNKNTNITNIKNDVKINSITVNGNINNQIIINNYGNENLSYIKDDELTRYVKNLPPGVFKLIEKIHFNPKHPENNNLRITNKKESFIQIRRKDKWLLEDKGEIINSLLFDKYQLLENHLSQIDSNKLTDKDQRIIERFRNNYEDNVQYVKNLLKKIELLILNNSH